MASIEESWKEATEGFDAEVRDTWLNIMYEGYSAEKHSYYNLESLAERLTHYYAIKDKLKNPQALLLAVFFQNLEYNPKAVAGESHSLDYFNSLADAAGISPTNEIRKETSALLQVAVTHSTEEHKVDGAFGDEDAHYLLDLDMAILGASPEVYADYREKIRGEYSCVGEPFYTSLRLMVLRSFLQIPNIYATKEFRDKYEQQARQNIQTEIELLS